MAQAGRPLSPHVSIYRWYFTMALSIAHRVTGAGLSVGLLLLAWWLTALAGGPESFAVVQAATSVLGATPGRVTGRMCARIRITELKQPMRFCNRYVSIAQEQADDGSLGHGRVLVEHLLDLPGADVQTAADDEVLPAIDNEAVAFLVNRGEVAGAQPACGRLQHFAGMTTRHLHALSPRTPLLRDDPFDGWLAQGVVRDVQMKAEPADDLGPGRRRP